jgi:hypothetical protein
VDAQVVQDQERFLVGVLDQCSQEFDQFVGVKTSYGGSIVPRTVG